MCDIPKIHQIKSRIKIFLFKTFSLLSSFNPNQKIFAVPIIVPSFLLFPPTVPLPLFPRRRPIPRCSAACRPRATARRDHRRDFRHLSLFLSLSFSFLFLFPFSFFFFIFLFSFHPSPLFLLSLLSPPHAAEQLAATPTLLLARSCARASLPTCPRTRAPPSTPSPSPPRCAPGPRVRTRTAWPRRPPRRSPLAARRRPPRTRPA